MGDMKMPHMRTFAIIFAAALGLTACKEKPQATSTTLDIASVQGSSFDEPVTTAPATAVEGQGSEVAIATPAPVTIGGASAAAPAVTELASAPAPSQTSEQPFAVVGSSQDAVTSAPTQIITAEQLPADISTIPNATPVPAQLTPVPAPAVAAAPAPAVKAGEFEEVSFNVLSGFKYEEPIPQEGEKPEDVEKRRQADQIPGNVKALDGKKAVVQGWMVPMEVNEDGSVKSFVLVKTQPQCCFGDMQAMNEWIDVVMQPGHNAQFNVDLPIKVYGQLEVGEKKQDGFVLSIYRMQAQRVDI